MKIFCEIDKSLPKVVRETAEERVATKFDRFTDVIEEVQLILKDLNGPRGGVDTQCLVSIRLRNMPNIIIDQRSESIGKAMFSALERAARSLTRKLSRKTDYQQKRAIKLGDPQFAR